MTEMKKRANILKDIRDYIYKNKQYIVPGVVGAAGLGGLGYLGSSLLWKNPSKSQRILMTLAGVSVGLGGSTLLADQLKNHDQSLPDKLISTYEQSLHAFPSLLGSRPSKEKWKTLAPFSKSLYGSNDTGSAFTNIFGGAINTLKSSLPGTNQSTAQNISTVGANTLGAYLAGKPVMDNIKNTARSESILQDIRQVLNSLKGTSNTDISQIQNRLINKGIGEKAALTLLDPDRFQDESTKQVLKNLNKNLKSKNYKLGIKGGLKVGGAGLLGALTSGLLVNTLTGANKEYKQWLKQVERNNYE